MSSFVSFEVGGERPKELVGYDAALVVWEAFSRASYTSKLSNP
jgi:hypothetical protein